MTTGIGGRKLLRSKLLSLYSQAKQRKLAELPSSGVRGYDGFTLIELVIVITIILILISIAVPIYRTSIIRSKEAVLRDNLFTLRALIDQYTLDKQKAPQSLEDLSAEGYIREIPTDPFTGSNQTWAVDYESDVLMSADQTAPGIVDVHSGSNLTSLSGEAYSSW